MALSAEMDTMNTKLRYVEYREMNNNLKPHECVRQFCKKIELLENSICKDITFFDKGDLELEKVLRGYEASNAYMNLRSSCITIKEILGKCAINTRKY